MLQPHIVQVQFSPDGRWIATASFDKAVKLWDGQKGGFVATLRGHVGPVYQLAWSSDSRLLVSGSKDSTLKVGIRLTGASSTVVCFLIGSEQQKNCFIGLVKVAGWSIKAVLPRQAFHCVHVTAGVGCGKPKAEGGSAWACRRGLLHRLEP